MLTGNPPTDGEGDNELHNVGKKHYSLNVDLASDALLTYPSDWGPGICTMPVRFARPHTCLGGEMQVKSGWATHPRRTEMEETTLIQFTRSAMIFWGKCI